MTPAGGPDLEPRPFEARAAGGNVLRGEASGDGAGDRPGARDHRRPLLRDARIEAAPAARLHGGAVRRARPRRVRCRRRPARSTLRGARARHGRGRRVAVGGRSGSCSPATRWGRTRPRPLPSPSRTGSPAWSRSGPASRGLPPSPETIAYWDGLADGLERGGVEGFIEVYDDGSHDPEWRDVVLRLARRRLGLHRDLNAVAAALRSTTALDPVRRPRGARGDRRPDAGRRQPRRGRSRPSVGSRRGVDPSGSRTRAW